MKTELDREGALLKGPLTQSRGTTGWYTWHETVCRLCGPDATIEWTKTGCIVLGVMEFFY